MAVTRRAAADITANVESGSPAAAIRRVAAAFVVSAAITVVAIVTVDDPIARAIAPYAAWSGWERALSVLEVVVGIEPWRFGLVAVLGAAVALTLAVPRLRPHARAAMYVALVYLLARNLMFWGKVCTARLRPGEWIAEGGHEWFRFADGGASFPSGHVVLIGGLFIPLAVVAPRTRPLLACVAFACAARLALNAHFVSDIAGGLALVTGLAWACSPLLRGASR